MRRYYCLFIIIVLESGVVIYAQEWSAQDSIWLQRILNGTETIRLNEATWKAIESGTLIHDPIMELLKASPKEIPINQSFEGITSPASQRKQISELPPAVYLLQILNHKDSLPDVRQATTFNAATIHDLKMLDAVTHRKTTVDDPFTIRSGGSGDTSFEDILRTIFWPSHRAKQRNAKNANAWKTYNEGQ